MSNMTVDISEVYTNMMRVRDDAEIAIQMKAKEGADLFQNYAKQNRPWTDRTGRARQGLTGYVETERDGVKIVIAHGVDYGVSLENEHEQRYAICWPTVQAMSQRVLASLNGLIERLGL